MKTALGVLCAGLLAAAASSCARHTQAPPAASIATLDLSHQRLVIPIDVYYPREAEAPHPVVIDLHGCSGIIAARRDGWVERLNRWGYAVIKMDSFTPRGDANICDETLKISPLHRLNDLAGAIAYAVKDAKLDGGRVFAMGMSHGATTVMLAHRQARDIFRRLKGIVAYYPYCVAHLHRLVADTIILIGENDDWTPAEYCRGMQVDDRRGYALERVFYPGAWHSFDVPGADGLYYGHRLRYDRAAAEDSFARVREFLRTRL